MSDYIYRVYVSGVYSTAERHVVTYKRKCEAEAFIDRNKDLPQYRLVGGRFSGIPGRLEIRRTKLGVVDEP